MSPFVKNIGPFALSISDKGEGVFEAAISLSGSAGGGNAAGVAKFGGSLYCDLSLEQVAALGFEELNKIIPAAILPLAEKAEGALEAEIEKI